jgi:hypothetical protein
MTDVKPEDFDSNSGGQAGGICEDNSEPPASNNPSIVNDSSSGIMAAVPPSKTLAFNSNYQTAVDSAAPIELVNGGETNTCNTGKAVAHDSNSPTTGLDHDTEDSNQNNVSASVTPYYQQFTNMNAQAQAEEVIRNSYQPYHRPPANDDPEVAQAMLHLGSQNANEISSGDNGHDSENVDNLKSFSSSNPPVSSLVGGTNNFPDAALSPYQQNHQTEQHRRPESAIYSTESNRSLKDFHDHHYQDLQSVPHVSNTSHQDLRAMKDGNDGMDNHFHSHPRQQHLSYPIQPSHHHYNYGLSSSNHHQNPPPHGHHPLGYPVPLQSYRPDHHRDDSMLPQQQNGHPYYSVHPAAKSEAVVPQNVGNMQGVHNSGQVPQQGGHYPEHLQRSANIPQYMVTAGGAHFMDTYSHGHNHTYQQQHQQQQVLQVTQSKMDSMQKKRKRPVDMPRRPLSAYNFFFSEERVRLLAEIPNPDADQASKELIDTSTVSLDDKQEIHDVSSASSERLLKIRDAKVVKRRPHRKSHGKIAFKDLAREVGKRWKVLNDVEKSRYNDLAEKDLQRYNEQMKDYNSKRNRFAGASYQTSPGPLPPQLNVTNMNMSGLSNEKNTVSSLRNIPNLSRGHMQMGQSNNMNHVDVQYPNVFNAVPLHYPQHEGAPQPVDSDDANFFLNTHASMDAHPFDSHMLQYTTDPYHPANSQQKHNNVPLDVGGSMPSIDVGAASETGRVTEPTE